jgi:hypothetical protein
VIAVLARQTSSERAPLLCARSKHAPERSTLLPPSKSYRKAAAVSLWAIAAGLDERGIPATRGDSWFATQVQRLLEIISNPFHVTDAALA